jgi:hypothetical protein
VTPLLGRGEGNDSGMRRLRRRCARLVRDITVPVPFDAQALCGEVGDRLGQPIHLLPVAMPADGPSGLVISGTRAHYLCYDSGTRPLHQQHIIAHELGHLIAGHTTGHIDEGRGPGVAALLSTLDPVVVRQALARDAGYDRRQEAEAEIIADLLLQRAHSWSPERTWHVPMDAADVVARIERSLG